MSFKTTILAATAAAALALPAFAGSEIEIHDSFARAAGSAPRATSPSAPSCTPISPRAT